MIIGFSFFFPVDMTVCLFTGRLGKIRKIDRVLMCWWAFTGLTHIILEGYFVFSPEFYKDKTVNYIAEVCECFNCFSTLLKSHSQHLNLQCLSMSKQFQVMKILYEQLTGKEYSKGDSRYVARDATIVTVEGITSVLEGPASLLAV